MRKIKKLLTVLFSLALVVGLVAAAETYTPSVANAAEQTEATVDYGGAALRDDFFLIGVSTGDVSWTDQTASGRVSYADVKINGETQSVEVCYYGDDKLAYFIVPYALVPTDMTTSLIIPSGTVLDKIATKNELLYNLKGHSEIKTNVRRSNATFASGAPQDGNKRYLIYIETGGATADDAWTPNKFLLDGKEVTPNVANTGTEYFVCLDYSFFAENVTSHTQITDEHLFTISAGTAIGSIVVENEWNFEEDMVSGDTALVAKFNEAVRKYKVTFDGGNETEVEYDTLLTKPEDPTKAATETTVYTFKGWFDGEKEWNFETDKVKKDTALVAKFDEADRLYIVTVKYTGVEKTDGEIKAKYNEKIDFIDFELDGYTYKVTKGGAEITELTVKGDDEITVTYEKKADPEPTESENPSESGNDSETNKPTGSESIKDSKTEEKSGCFGNVAGASAGVFVALIAAVAILRKRR